MYVVARAMSARTCDTGMRRISTRVYHDRTDKNDREKGFLGA